MRKKRIAFMCSVVLALGLLSGCGNSDTAKENEKTNGTQGQSALEEDTFTAAINYMPASLMPDTMSDDSVSMLRPIFDPLYSETKDGMEYYLVENLEISEDGKTYTVSMNPKATWSDGEAVTVDDILFTIDYALLSTGMSEFASVNEQDVNFNKIDDKTLEIVLPESYAIYKAEFGRMMILPSHAFENDPSKVDDSGYFNSPDMVTSGAYTVSEINEDSLVYEAREDYYRGEPSVKKVIMKTMGDGSTKQVAFENGEISYMRITTPEEIEKYEAESDKYNIYSIPEARLNYLQLSPTGPGKDHLTDDARKALFLALNNEEIIDVAYGSDKLASPANSLLTPEQILYNSDCKGYTQNLEEAKKLAKSSGLEGQTLVYIYNADRPNMEAVATVVQQQLAEIGVNLSIESLDSTTFFSRFFGEMWGEEGSWDIGSNGWDSMRGSTLAQSFNYFNYMCGFSDEVATAAAGVNSALSEEEAIELAKTLQDKTLEECWEYPLTYTNYLMVSQKNITGLDGKPIVPEFIDYLTLKVD